VLYVQGCEHEGVIGETQAAGVEVAVGVVTGEARE
jgi:hypothetical protein